MRLRSALAAAPLLVAIACADDPPAGPPSISTAQARAQGGIIGDDECEPARIIVLIATTLPPRERGAAQRDFTSARRLDAAGDNDAAWPTYLALAEQTLEHALAGRLRNPPGPLTAVEAAVTLVDLLYQCGERPPVAATIRDILTGARDFVVETVGPNEPTQIVVPSANFGIVNEAGDFFDEQALLIIERVPDDPPFLPQQYTEYPPRYQVYVLPASAQANFGGTPGPGSPTMLVVICPGDPHPDVDEMDILRVPDAYPAEPAQLLDAEHVHGYGVTCTDAGEYPAPQVGAAPSLGDRMVGALQRGAATAFGWLAPEPLYAVDGGIGGRTFLMSSYVAVARERAPTPGADVVVFNDANMFDDLALANAGNRQLVRNLVGFTAPGARNAGTLVVLEAGHETAYARCVDTAAENEIVEAGYTFVRQASAVVGPQPASAKVLILCLPTTPYSRTEINAMKQFAGEGGRIVFIGENARYYDGIPIQNQFLRDMGAVMTSVGAAIDCVGFTQQRPKSLPAASLRSHHIMTGVDELDMACASVIVPGEGDVALFYDRSNRSVLGGVARIDVTPLPPPAVASARRAGSTAAPSVAAAARTHDLEGRPLPR